MPRVSLSNDCLFDGSGHRTLNSLTDCSNYNYHYYQQPLFNTEVTTHETTTNLSPDEIDEILSRKLYNRLATTSSIRDEEYLNKTAQSLICPKLKPAFDSLSTTTIDPELLVLIDRFFNLTYLNTIPMVNLLATAMTTHILKENIQQLDKKLQQQQEIPLNIDVKRRTSLVDGTEYDKCDDDNLSWISAPT